MATASEAPLARYFLACQKVAVESVSRNVTLENLIHAIVRLPGESFPCMREEIAFYAALVNGRGKHELSIELTRFEEAANVSLRLWKGGVFDFGKDPVALHGLPIRLRGITFSEPGQFR